MENKFVFDTKKERYDFKVFHISEFNNDVLFSIAESETGRVKKSLKRAGGNKYIKVLQYARIGQRGRRQKSYIVNLRCAFDIETSKVKQGNNEYSFMYTWQFAINNNVIVGNTWGEFLELLGILKNLQYNDKHRIIVFVANLGFEWQFMKKLLNVTDYFFKELREPVYIEHDGFVVFKEALSWGGSLKKLANDYTRLRKMSGDLDYSILRTPLNCKLTGKEKMYCYMDVLILSEFAKWFYKEYLVNNGIIPLTVASALRNEVKKRIGRDNLKLVQASCKKCQPQTNDEYNVVMNLLYRGGYVHGNIMYVGDLLKNGLLSFDITSSYPASMAHMEFPLKFVEMRVTALSELKKLIADNKAFYGLFCFTNLRAKYSHSIESTSKCLEYYTCKKEWLGKITVDNGRVFKTGEKVKTTVYLTELDFINYTRFYEWGEVEIIGMLRVAPKRKLPKYLLDVMFINYTRKAELKKMGEPYAIEKTYVNTMYGMCVTKFNDSEIELKEGETVKCKVDNFDKQNNKVFLSAYWGVWVSAYSRYKLLDMVWKLENGGYPVIYCDTDSIKAIDTDGKLKDFFERENKKYLDRNKEICEYYGLDLEIYKDLGAWDFEEKIEYFKFLGAKRYLFTYKGDDGKRHYNCTVAGLPKAEYYKRYTNNVMQFFKPFNNGMCVRNCKLGSKYIDSEVQIWVDGEEILIPSQVVLVDSDFTMSLDTDWVSILENIVNSKGEKRIYG